MCKKFGGLCCCFGFWCREVVKKCKVLICCCMEYFGSSVKCDSISMKVDSISVRFDSIGVNDVSISVKLNIGS